MSAGGVFKLIANDGKADRMIMATEVLNQRIKDIMCVRAQQGYRDQTPTLVDIERTHILFVNAHFKPFAAIGYEYNKVRPHSGTSNFGGTVQFSIPQFGDFFHDMVVNVTLSAVSATTGTVPAYQTGLSTGLGANTTTAFGGAPITTTGAVGVYATTGIEESDDFGTVANTYLRVQQRYVTLDMTVVAVASAATNFVRYAEYPGQRLFKKVRFDVNSNPLDEYTSEAMMFYQKFKVAPHKEVGWNRLVGQENPIKGFSGHCNMTGESQYPQDLVTAGFAADSTDTSRKEVNIVNGPQTPKATQPILDLWIPILFWFNNDARLSIASVSIPYGQRFITIELEAQDRLVFTAPGNLFREYIAETMVNSNGENDGTTVSDYQKFVTRSQVLASNSTVNTSQSITKVELYINNIFVNPEIHDIYIKRIGFSLIRVYRFQSKTVNTATDSILMSQLKWPIETIFAGLRPTVNTLSSNSNQWRDWHRLTLLTDNTCEQLQVSQFPLFGTSVNATPSSITTQELLTDTMSCKSPCESITYPVSTKTIDTIKITAHGIPIFDNFADEFFADYMPYHYGGVNIVTPSDEGAIMINFCLYPGTYQPSGHINVSRAREFFFDYTSSYVTSATPANLLILAIAVNFLLISDGSAVLRYST